MITYALKTMVQRKKNKFIKDTKCDFWIKFDVHYLFSFTSFLFVGDHVDMCFAGFG